MKKILFLISLIFIPIFAYSYDAYVNGIYYNLISGSEVEVTYQYGDGHSYSQEVNIPETIEYKGKTYQVTTIGHHAFYNCDKLLKVNMPNSIKSIGNNAFCLSVTLSSITLSNILTSSKSHM